MRGPCEYEVGPAKPLKHTCQLGEVASSETCNDREIYPFLPVEVHTRDGALRKARYQNIFIISDEKNGTLLDNWSISFWVWYWFYSWAKQILFWRLIVWKSFSWTGGSLKQQDWKLFLSQKLHNRWLHNNYSRIVESMLNKPHSFNSARLPKRLPTLMWMKRRLCSKLKTDNSKKIASFWGCLQLRAA